jgi:predicted Zn-dependent protease
MRAVLSILLVAALALPPAAAHELPDLGDVSEATLSASQERAIGYQIMRRIRSDPSYLDDPEVTDYLNGIGYRLVGASPDARSAFFFFALRDNSVNAFALPGGFIGVHSGLFLTAQSESELASVLAHEIAHVTQRHIARMVAQQQRAGMASLAAIALAILAARSNPQAAAGAIAAAQAQQVDAALAFTRDNEREADRVGVQILQKSGFDPHAMPVFLDRMQRATRIYDTGAPTYMRTHPITYERIADVQNRTAEVPYRQVPDSLDFWLVRAKLRVGVGDPREAVTFFEQQIAERKSANEIAAHYGLTAALLRAERLDAASRALGALKAMAPPHPMVALLEARVQLARKDTPGAFRTLAEAARTFPGHRALAYQYAESLIEAGRPGDALAVLDRQLLRDQNDGRLYELQARAYDAQGRGMLKHGALAEAYLASGNVMLAIEQLQLALTNSDGDFYTTSSVEARLRELRSIVAQAQKK